MTVTDLTRAVNGWSLTLYNPNSPRSLYHRGIHRRFALISEKHSSRAPLWQANINNDFIIGCQNPTLLIFGDRMPFKQFLDITMHVLVITTNLPGQLCNAQGT